MCVSLLIETSPERLAAALGISQIPGSETDFNTRVEGRGTACVLRLGAGGRIVAERMTFNPYVLRGTNITGDLWAHSLIGESHGLIVLQAFSEWTSADRLVRSGAVSVFEVNCAFNRFAVEVSDRLAPDSVRERLVLANFKPRYARFMLVPVLFDWARQQRSDNVREFAIISDEPPADVASVGAEHAPVCLSQEAAMAWLHTVDPSVHTSEDEPESEELDLDEILQDNPPTGYQFSLYKSA